LPSAHEGALAEIRAQISALVERLDDLALESLHEAVASGATARPEVERRIVRARNALLRAGGILDGVPRDPGDYMA
jgi:hypothetical protein